MTLRRLLVSIFLNHKKTMQYIGRYLSYSLINNFIMYYHIFALKCELAFCSKCFIFILFIPTQNIYSFNMDSHRKCHETTADISISFSMDHITPPVSTLFVCLLYCFYSVFDTHNEALVLAVLTTNSDYT